MFNPLDVGALLRRLHCAGVDYVLIGGLAVNAHGVIRSTKDVDICPAPDRPNLARLADLLLGLGVQQLGVGEGGFEAREMPHDPTRAEDLAEGGNFRLQTPLGVLDIMQWVPGIDADLAYEVLSRDAETATAFGVEIEVCSLEHLRAMKVAAGRPQDLLDLADLEIAHPRRHES
jgi:hypothetical protein